MICKKPVLDYGEEGHKEKTTFKVLHWDSLSQRSVVAVNVGWICEIKIQF